MYNGVSAHSCIVEYPFTFTILSIGCFFLLFKVQFSLLSTELLSHYSNVALLKVIFIFESKL